MIHYNNPETQQYFISVPGSDQGYLHGVFPKQYRLPGTFAGAITGYCGSNVQSSTFAIIPGKNGCKIALANVSVQGIAASFLPQQISWLGYCASKHLGWDIVLANILAGILH